MFDSQLTSMITSELQAFLRTRHDLEGPVYATSLWSNGEYGELGIGIATQPAFERQREAPAYGDIPPEVMAAPASVRWNPGDWDIVAERFVSDSTQQKLDRIGESISDAGALALDNPDAMPELCALMHRWQLMSNQILHDARPLDLLDCTCDAIAYAEFANYTRPVELAMSMTLTVEPELLHRLFPQWRALCESIWSHAARTDGLAKLRALNGQERGGRVSVDEQVPLPMETQQLLRDCGFSWRDLARWNGARVPADLDPEVPNAGTGDPIALAFVVADRIG